MRNFLRCRRAWSGWLLFALLISLVGGARAARADAGVHIKAVVPITAGPVGRYEKFEVGLTLDRDFGADTLHGNPFDPAEVSVEAAFVSPSGQNTVRYGFYYQDFSIQRKYLVANDARYWQPAATPQPWRVRFAPGEKGTWRYTLTVSYRDGTTETLPARTFECVASANDGFLKVAPNRRQLVFDQGQSFLAIGSNVDYWGDNALAVPAGLAAGSPNVSLCGKRPVMLLPARQQYRFSTYTYTAYEQVFEQLHAVKGNFARVWLQASNWDIETYDSTTRVNTLGYYQPHQPRMYDLDRLLLAAKANGVYLHLSLLDGARLWNNTTSRQWRTFPYKVGLGLGPHEQRRFFTEPAARRLFKNKLRYIVARWGYSPQIASYELLNEGDFIDAGLIFGQNYRQDLPPLWRWTVEMATYLKALDGRHLQTTAYGPENGYELLRDHPDLFDYTTSHDYTASFNAELRRNYLTQAMTRLHHRPYQLQEVDYSPYINTSYAAKFHTMPWATAFSGSLGIGLALSGFSNLHHPCYPAYQQYQPLARFLALSGFHSADANEPIGNVSGAAVALYGPQYPAGLAQKAALPLFATAPAGANPAYFSPCDLRCPPGWLQSVGIAPNFGPPLSKADSLNQNDRTDYLVHGANTSQDGLLEVYALRNPGRIIGWIHNKTHYWYNLPHTIQSGGFCEDGNCADNPGVATDLNNATSNTITPLTGQVLRVATGDLADLLSTSPVTYRVRWFYTHLGHDADGDGDPNNGGFVRQWEQPAVPVVGGALQVAVPPLVALGSRGPGSAPDYAFCLVRNPPNTAATLALPPRARRL
jgi:hypothetical protein